MAAINFYLANAADAGWQRLSEATQAAATMVGGWVVGTGATNHSEFEQGVERAASTFVNTTPPDGALDTALNDAFRSENAYTGDFAAADWTFHFVVRAVTNGGAQDGRVRFRLIKADADGLNATEITAAQQQASIVTNVSTSADFDSSLTFNPGAFSIANQHLFVQLAWERTGAGGMSTSDIDFRTGSSTTAGTRITTSNFTPGAQTVSAAGAIGGAETFGTAKLNFTVLNVGALASGEAFAAAKVSFAVLNAGGIGSAEAIGSPTLTITGGGLTISSAGAIGTAEAFGTAKLNFAISGTGAIGSAEAFGSGQANFTILGAGNIATGGVIGAHSVTQPGAPQTVSGAGAIASFEGFGQPSAHVYVGDTSFVPIGGVALRRSRLKAKRKRKNEKERLQLAVGSIASSAAVGTPILLLGPAAQRINRAGGIPGAEAIGSLRLNFAIGILGIPSGEDFGAPFIDIRRTEAARRAEERSILGVGP